MSCCTLALLFIYLIDLGVSILGAPHVRVEKEFSHLQTAT